MYRKSCLVENTPHALLSPPTCIRSFIVPSSPGLNVPNKPTAPTYTLTLIATKLEKIDKFNVQQRESELKFLFNRPSRFSSFLG